MKKQSFNFIIISLILSVFLIMPLFLGGMYLSDDKYFHLIRIDSLYNALKNFNLYPSIYEDMIYGYGYGLPLFYPQLFLYVPAVFMLFGVSLDNSYNLFLILTNIMTLFISYKCFFIFFKKKNYAYTISILYLIMPYRLNVLYNRNALGELIAITFIPMLFLFIYKFIVEDKIDKVLLIGVFSLILNAHLISTYISFLFLGIVFIINIKRVFKVRHIKSLIQSVFLVALINAYFLFPFVEQITSQRFLFNKNLLGGLAENSFSILKNDSIYLKLVLTIILITLLFILLKKCLINWSIYSKYLIFISTLIMLMSTNIFPWEIVNILLINNIQFPFRLFIILNITIPLLIIEIYLYLREKNYTVDFKNIFLKVMGAMLLINIIYSFSLTFVVDRVGDAHIFNKSLVIGGEYLTEGFTNDYLLNNIYKIKGSSKITYIKNKGEYFIDLNKSSFSSKIELPIIYYKGYAVSENLDKFIEVKRSENGLIELNPIKTITEDFKVFYKGTHIQKISIWVSVICLPVFIVFINIKRSLEI